MARLDVHRSPDGKGYVLDVQADLLERLGTRVVVPLLPRRGGPPSAARLNPIFVIGGRECVLVTQHIVAIPKSALGERVASLRGRSLLLDWLQTTAAVDVDLPESYDPPPEDVEL